jgi:radical SAM superfamily enzyme YgiQ (UPF0313 family)
MAALLPEDWELRLADLNTRRLSPEDWDWADLVMISGMIVHRENMLALLREAKERRKTTIVGGPYFTSVPQEALQAGADFLVRGEAENTLPLFLTALREGKTRGVFQQNRRPDMALSPVPRFDLLHLADYDTMSIQTSRGCPYDCEFCDVVNLYGRKPRYKSPAQVIEEMAALYRLGWRRMVFIADDNFIGNKEHARAILNKLIAWMKNHGEPFGFWTQASVNLGQDVETIDLMTEANFAYVFLGVETPDEDVLAQSRKHHNVRTPMNLALTNMTKNGLSVLASFMIGFDQEMKGAGERICRFVEENNIPLVMLNTLHALPNTSLWERLKREGRLLEERVSGDFLAIHLNYIPSRPESEIMQEYLDAVDRLYEPSAVLRRVYQHFLAMRATREALGLETAKNAATAGRSDHEPISLKLKELLSLMRVIWRQGVLAHYRWQFWRQLVGMRRKNPSRMRRYLTSCGLGENLFSIREIIARGGSSRQGKADETRDGKADIALPGS